MKLLLLLFTLVRAEGIPIDTGTLSKPQSNSDSSFSSDIKSYNFRLPPKKRPRLDTVDESDIAYYHNRFPGIEMQKQNLENDLERVQSALNNNNQNQESSSKKKSFTPNIEIESVPIEKESSISNDVSKSQLYHRPTPFHRIHTTKSTLKTESFLNKEKLARIMRSKIQKTYNTLNREEINTSLLLPQQQSKEFVQVDTMTAFNSLIHPTIIKFNDALYSFLEEKRLNKLTAAFYSYHNNSTINILGIASLIIDTIPSNLQSNFVEQIRTKIAVDFYRATCLARLSNCLSPLYEITLLKDTLNALPVNYSTIQEILMLVEKFHALYIKTDGSRHLWKPLLQSVSMRLHEIKEYMILRRHRTTI